MTLVLAHARPLGALLLSALRNKKMHRRCAYLVTAVVVNVASTWATATILGR